MAEVQISKKRNAMEMCHKLIPMMNDEEISQLGIVLMAVCDRLIKEGRVYDDEE